MKESLIFLYGSATGNAESIAKQLYQTALSTYPDAQCLELNEVVKQKLLEPYWKGGGEAEDNLLPPVLPVPLRLVIVCSTTGEGEVPENGIRFQRILRTATKTNKRLYSERVRYTVLALGDTNYSNFCAAGIWFDRQFLSAGATRFYPRSDADDAIDMEDVVEAWEEGLWDAIEEDMAATPSPPAEKEESPTATKESSPVTIPSLSEEGKGNTTDESESEPSADLHQCRLHSWRRLTVSLQDPVIEVNFTLSDSLHTWKPGQTVSITPPNPPDAVLQVLQCFHVSVDELFPHSSQVSSPFASSPLYACAGLFPMRCQQVVSQLVSLTVTRHNKRLFDLLSNHQSMTQEDRVKVLSVWNSLQSREIVAVGLIEVLNMIPFSVLPPFRHVMELLSKLQPRSYSISSSSAVSPQLLSLCVRVVPMGLCSNWLYQQCQRLDKHPQGAQRECNVMYSIKSECIVPVRFLPPTWFQFPKEKSKDPVIYIGPGTGIAPFRAFAQEVASSSVATTPRRVELFFGCRTEGDYLFADELKSFESSGVISSIHVAFSREEHEGHGKYVGDEILKVGRSLSHLMVDLNAKVMVCGDADHMSRDVANALIRVLQTTRNWTEEKASEYVQSMRDDRQYVEDVWTTADPTTTLEK